MKKYYFTFGGNHYTTDGTCMRDYYVVVSAPDYGTARNHFCQHFALPMMGNASKWSFQYEEKDFKFHFFPAGEFEHLIATVTINTEIGDIEI